MSRVTIGCKVANGILMQAQVNGKIVEHRINGFNQSPIIGAEHGITHDVPEALWQTWLAQFKDSKLVKGGFIFAHKAEKEVKAQAKDTKDNKSGTEQMPQPKGKAKEGAIGKVD